MLAGAASPSGTSVGQLQKTGCSHLPQKSSVGVRRAQTSVCSPSNSGGISYAPRRSLKVEREVAEAVKLCRFNGTFTGDTESTRSSVDPADDPAPPRQEEKRAAVKTTGGHGLKVQVTTACLNQVLLGTVRRQSPALGFTSSQPEQLQF